MIVDPDVESDIEWLALLAPLHNPAVLALIRGCRDDIGKDVVQVVVPDTGFYTDLPEVASKYASPGDLCERYRIHGFGFHGLAHQAMLQRWQEWAGNPQRAGSHRMVDVVHILNDASILVRWPDCVMRQMNRMACSGVT